MKYNILLFGISLMIITWVTKSDAAREYGTSDQSSEIRFIRNPKLPDKMYQNELRNRPAWQNFNGKYEKWQVIFNEENAVPHRANGNPIKTYNTNPVEGARAFISNELSDFNIPVQDLRLMGSGESKKHYFVNFFQEFDGLNVLNSRLTVKMT